MAIAYPPGNVELVRGAIKEMSVADSLHAPGYDQVPYYAHVDLAIIIQVNRAAPAAIIPWFFRHSDGQVRNRVLP